MCQWRFRSRSNTSKPESSKTLMEELSKLSSKELLTLHGKIADELRARGITRSANNPTGDLAEYLFRTAFGWTRAGNSHPNGDAIGDDGLRFQIRSSQRQQREQGE